MDKKQDSTVGKTVDAFEFIGSMATERSSEQSDACVDKDAQESEENLEQDSVKE